MLREFHRLLSPGGASWQASQTTGRTKRNEPDPHHLQVYDWARLQREMAAHFIVETAVAQTASQSKARGARN